MELINSILIDRLPDEDVEALLKNYYPISYAAIMDIRERFGEKSLPQMRAESDLAELERIKKQKAYENQQTLDQLRNFLENGYYTVNIPNAKDPIVGPFKYGYASIFYKTDDYNYEASWINCYGNPLKLGYLRTCPFTELGIAVFLDKDYNLGIINSEGEEMLIEKPQGLDIDVCNIEFHNFNGKICAKAIIWERDSRESSFRYVLIDINGKIIYTAEKGHSIKWDSLDKDKIDKILKCAPKSFIDFVELYDRSHSQETIIAI